MKTDEYANIKRIQDNLRSITREFKRTETRLSSHNTDLDADKASNLGKYEDKADKVISAINANIRKIDSKMDEDFDEIIDEVILTKKPSQKITNV